MQGVGVDIAKCYDKILRSLRPLLSPIPLGSPPLLSSPMPLLTSFASVPSLRERCHQKPRSRGEGYGRIILPYAQDALGAKLVDAFQRLQTEEPPAVLRGIQGQGQGALLSQPPAPQPAPRGRPLGPSPQRSMCSGNAAPSCYISAGSSPRRRTPGDDAPSYISVGSSRRVRWSCAEEVRGSRRWRDEMHARDEMQVQDNDEEVNDTEV